MQTSKPKITPGGVRADSQGTFTRRWFVRLPKGLVADDLKVPDLWSLVQANRGTALRRHDSVYAVGYGEDFAVEARVTDSNSANVVLGGMKIISFPERLTPLFQDESYRVIWTGTGYAVERRADTAQMGSEFGSEELAIRHLHRMYPQVVG